jgi:trypsin-like peptidase
VAPKGTPQPDQLDYAIVRLAGAPGTERGWIDISGAPVALAPGQPLSILQHPNAKPLKLALDTCAVIGINDNQTRLLYRTNTEDGSSGSPCFTIDWQAVALHHAGDSAAPKFPATRNAGVPLPTIRAHLEAIGKADAVTA